MTSFHHLHTIFLFFFIPIFAIKPLLSVSSSFSLQSRNQSSLRYDDNKVATRRRVSAIFVFGDSTVDPGNNNFLITDAKSNFPPYGIDFPGNRPTGRFTDGRLVTDFIASYIGVKDYVPPYLDPTLSLEELKTGVSFASAATGFDPLTASLTISTQLEYFREYKCKMERVIGKTETDYIIRNSAVVISAGTNDFVLNYLSLPIRSHSFTVSEYQQYIIDQLELLLQALINEGATKIGVVGLPPIGCLPFVLTLFSKDHNLFTAGQECIDSLSIIGETYNEMLQKRLRRYDSNHVKVVYADIFNPAVSIIKNPTKFGFQEAFKGCCGTGIFELSFLCNVESPLCSDVSKYVFFDSIHPTERTYYLVFESIKPTIDAELN